MSLLASINSPEDLRSLELGQLPQVAEEIRGEIIATVAENGGHLASNLGAVELTLALHYAFDTPRDAIVWDVGHQCYAHKLLTGRREQFSTLRQLDGLSGFCNREESPWDVHTTGHSSNSISLALGLAAARDLDNGNHQVVAVIGDGSLTGGEAFEALDHAGDLKRPLIVVLNDNEMSIDGNVGALASHLTRLRSNPRYDRAKVRTRAALERVPLVGKPLSSLISRGKQMLKSGLLPGMIFENLGFFYLGPVNGHDIPTLVQLLKRAQSSNKPVLLHVHTQKGKGYAPAEREPERWHSAEPFHIQAGLVKKEKPASFTSVFAQALLVQGERDENVVAITAAMADGTGLVEFGRRFPRRLYDVGIAEQHALTFAAGLATAGKKPVAAIYSTFLQRGFDQVIEDICLQKLGVVLAVDRAGIVGGDGCSHQGIFDLSYLSCLPNMTVLAPSDQGELRLMLDYALSLGSPVALRYPRAQAIDLPHSHPPLEQGRGVRLREGRDAAIFAIGSMVEPALAAAAILAKDGIEVRVTDARFAAPIDQQALALAVKECQGRLVTVEENVGPGGFGSACRNALADFPADLLSVCLPQVFPAHGGRDQLLAHFGLDGASIARSVRERWFSHEG